MSVGTLAGALYVTILAVAAGVGLGYWLGTRNRNPLNPLGLPTYTQMKELLDQAGKLAKGDDDPYADDVPTDNGKVVETHHMDPASGLRGIGHAANGNGKVVVEEPEEHPGPAAANIHTVVEALREHVGHKVSVVTTSMGSEGVLLCETCGTKVPLPDKTAIMAAEAGTVVDGD